MPRQGHVGAGAPTRRSHMKAIIRRRNAKQRMNDLALRSAERGYFRVPLAKRKLSPGEMREAIHRAVVAESIERNNRAEDALRRERESIRQLVGVGDNAFMAEMGHQNVGPRGPAFLARQEAERDAAIVIGEEFLARQNARALAAAHARAVAHHDAHFPAVAGRAPAADVVDPDVLWHAAQQAIYDNPYPHIGGVAAPMQLGVPIPRGIMQPAIRRYVGKRLRQMKHLGAFRHLHRPVYHRRGRDFRRVDMSGRPFGRTGRIETRRDFRRQGNSRPFKRT